MMFRTHEITGMVACTATIPYLVSHGIIDGSNAISLGLVFAGGLMGAMFPDIDSPTSKIRRGIRKTIKGNPQTDKRVINHRRAPHMPLFWAVIFGLIFYFIHEPHITTFFIGMTIGVASHLLIDMLNPAGIPLFGPISKKKVHLLKIHTNGTGENVFAVLMIALEVYLLFFSELHIIDLTSFAV